jgi:hypothetical protein
MAAGVTDFLATPQAPPSQQIVSQQMLATTLMEIGVPVDTSTLALAESFSRVGVAITQPNISDGRGLLKRDPEITPASIALASALGAPKSDGVLRALSAVIRGLPESGNVSDEALEQLTVSLGNGREAEATATQLKGLLSRLGHSIENKIIVREAIDSDPRLSLLALSSRSDRRSEGANQLASNIEGQQVLNQAASGHGPAAPFYFGFYAAGPDGRNIPVEIQVKREEQRRGGKHHSDDDDVTLTTLRISPERLGQLEVRLAATESGAMRCDVRAAQLGTMRLMRRHAPDLADSLTAAGWQVQRVTVTQEKEFPPLWFGGEILAQPRSLLDRKV